MHADNLSSSAQDYVKALWTLSEWSSGPVSTKHLAERLGLKAPAVSETIKRLTHQGLVLHKPYGGVQLTPEGRRLALTMVRRHRLLETFLVQVLDFGWDEVHDLAEVLEHAVSDVLIDRIEEKLDYPARDPHGDPIPRASGEIDLPRARILYHMDTGETSTVQRISDADPEMLRYLQREGVTVGSVVTLLERRDYAGVLVVRTATSRKAPLGVVAAQSIWVADADAEAADLS